MYWKSTYRHHFVSDFSWPAASPHRAEIQAAASAARGQTAKLRRASSRQGVLSGSGSCAQWVATSLSHQYINVYKNKTFIIHQDTRKMWGVTMPAKIKGTVSRDFLLLVLFMNQFPPSPRVFHEDRFEFFRKFAEIFAAQGLPPVSLTPVANGKNLQLEKF